MFSRRVFRWLSRGVSSCEQAFAECFVELFREERVCAALLPQWLHGGFVANSIQTKLYGSQSGGQPRQYSLASAFLTVASLSNRSTTKGHLKKGGTLSYTVSLKPRETVCGPRSFFVTLKALDLAHQSVISPVGQKASLQELSAASLEAGCVLASLTVSRITRCCYLPARAWPPSCSCRLERAPPCNAVAKSHTSIEAGHFCHVTDQMHVTDPVTLTVAKTGRGVIAASCNGHKLTGH